MDFENSNFSENVFFSKKRPLRENADTTKKCFTDFFRFFRENFLCITNFHTRKLYLSSGKTAIFRTQFSCQSSIEFSHNTIKSSHTTINFSHTTIESSHTTLESSESTIESCRTTIESFQSTMKAEIPGKWSNLT